MTEIESNLNLVNFNAINVFEFLCNLNNHKKLMPSQVTDWWSNEEEAKLKIQGLGSLHLKKDIIKENSYIKIIPIGAAPVDLYIEWHIVEQGENCQVKAIIFAELNMFMKMVATKPLQGLADYMASKVNVAVTET